MKKYKKGIGVYMIIAAAILALVAAILYRSVMYRDPSVYYFLGGAVALAALAFILSGILPRVSGYIPVVMSAVLAYAAVSGTTLMVNQIGYVYAGLDGISTIMTYIYFIGFTLVGMLLCIVASFMRLAKPAKK